MIEKIKNIVIALLFIAVITGFAIVNAVAPDKTVSNAERRRLKLFDDVEISGLGTGESNDDLEEYFRDQFVFRDLFRSLKAANEHFLLNRNDSKGVYVKNGYVSKLDYPLDEEMILQAASTFNKLYTSLFDGYNVYYSVIPDKNYYLSASDGFPHMDYTSLLEILSENCEFTYIDIFTSLDIGDYYRSDLHWNQKEIIPVADKLLAQMGRETPLRDGYKTSSFSPFYGSFFGQAALPVGADTLTYYYNDILDECRLINPVSGENGVLYDTNAFSGFDPYSVFLNGVQPLLVIENPSANDEKTLYLIRDSFGSSIAPLMVEAYSRIVLIDLRYIDYDRIADYVEISGQGDVLFLMSVTMLNRSYLFKGN